MAAGRKPIYHPETLKIGEKIALEDRVKDFADQYVYQFRDKNKGKEFKKRVEDGKVFIERIQ
jgi:hypothetical protein